MVMNILASISQWEREIIGERTCEGLQQKKFNGEKTGGTVPFGYDIADYITKKNKQNKTYRVPVLKMNPIEQEVIKYIFKMRAKSYSLRNICRKLEKKKHKTKTGQSHHWQPVVVSSILNRKVLINCKPLSEGLQ